MELHIQELVDTIKRDGIEEAKRQASELLCEARAQKEQIIGEGTKEAARIIEQARKDAAVLRQSGEAAVKQAGRDVLLSLEKAIKARFDALLTLQIGELLSGNDMATLIVQVVRSGLAAPSESIVEVAQKDFVVWGAMLQAKLADELKHGLVLKPVEDVAAGFRLSAKDGKSYYDFGVDGIVALLKPFLNPVVQGLIGSAVAE